MLAFMGWNGRIKSDHKFAAILKFNTRANTFRMGTVINAKRNLPFG
jgi:hypothetical protein